MWRVLPDVAALDRLFDYWAPPGAAPPIGTVVRVDLHGRRVRGWVLAVADGPDVAADLVRPVRAVVSAGPPADVVALCEWAAWRWAGPRATFLRAASPPNVVSPDLVDVDVAVHPPVPGPLALPDRPGRLVVWPPARPREGLVVSLLAVEGSTIVVAPDPSERARLAAAAEATGRVVVALAGDDPAATRAAAWQAARRGACVVLGGRVAALAPIPDLRAAVVLDDADTALVEERAPTWHARDLLLERARRAGAVATVVTPVPTVEALTALGDPVALPASVGAGRLAAPRGRRPARGTAGARAPRGAARRRAAPHPGRWRPRGVRPEPARPRPAPRVPPVRHPRPLRALRRRGRRARRRARVPARRRDAAPRCAWSAVRRACGPRRPGCAASATTSRRCCPGSRSASPRPAATSTPTPRSWSAPRRRCTASPPTGRRSASSPSSTSTRSCSPPASGRSSRRSGCSCAAPASSATTAGAACLLAQTRVPDHPVFDAVEDGDPIPLLHEEATRRATLALPPFGGLAVLSGDAAAVDAAAAALAAPLEVLGPVDGRALVRAPSTRRARRRPRRGRPRDRTRRRSAARRRRSATRVAEKSTGSLAR